MNFLPKRIFQKFFLRNFLYAKYTGTALQINNAENDIMIPEALPVISLKFAPVYPISADISSFSRIKTLDKSTGFRIVSISTIFSSG